METEGKSKGPLISNVDHNKTSINVVTRDRRKRIFPRSVNKQRIKTPKVQSQIFNYNHSLFTENLKLTAQKPDKKHYAT